MGKANLDSVDNTIPCPLENSEIVMKSLVLNEIVESLHLTGGEQTHVINEGPKATGMVHVNVNVSKIIRLSELAGYSVGSSRALEEEMMNS